MAQYGVTIIIALLVLGFGIYRQMRSARIQPRQLVIFPVILAFVGLSNLERHAPESAAAYAAFGVSVVAALVFGLARGWSMRVWQVQGIPWRKGTMVTAALWGISLLARIAIGVGAQRAGVAASVTTGEFPVFLAVTLAAQNAVIWLRGT